MTLKPGWVKAHVRLAVACMGLKKYEEGRKAYVRAIELEPANAQLRESLQHAERLITSEEEKNWEDDLWSDEEDNLPSVDERSRTIPAASGSKRAVDDCEASRASVGKRRKKPAASLMAELDRSLKDASEDTLRACLAQISRADEQVCQRALHILEGLNAASSADEDDDDEGGNHLNWLGLKSTNRTRPDEDSD